MLTRLISLNWTLHNKPLHDIQYKYHINQVISQYFSHISDNKNIFQVISSGDIHSIEIQDIRNFSVIAHVDHGKSTLSDAILQYLGNIDAKTRKKGQVLDNLKVERDRGITVKAQTASMIFNDQRSHKRYLLNLIDTPGHIDFNYEVSRSLASCQGALLLVDASQSIQAQTISNYHKALKLNLDIIPVVTKTDLPNAMPEETALALEQSFKFDPDKVIMTSAKQNIGILEVIEAIVDRLPSPIIQFAKQECKDRDNNSRDRKNSTISIDIDEPFRGRIVDSWFDEHRGVVCLVQVCNGSVSEGQRISTLASVRDFQELGIDSRIDFSVQEIGFLSPEPLRTMKLKQGQVGYIISGMRSTRQARIGDTMYIPQEIADMNYKTNKKEFAEAYSTILFIPSSDNNSGFIEIKPLSGYEKVKPMLYASIFPVDSDDLEGLFAAVDRLCLNDSSISVSKEHSTALGSGLRCGFLGYLHMEVFSQRLQDEYGMNIVMTTPSVPYCIRYLSDHNGQIQNIGSGICQLLPTDVLISNISEWPDTSKPFVAPASYTETGATIAINHGHYKILEPVVKVTIISPNDYYGVLLDVVKLRRASDIEVAYLDDGKTFQLNAHVPWQEIVLDMHDVIKNSSSGYASFDYEESGYQMSPLVKVEICVNGDVCDPLSIICHQDQAADQGRRLALKLKEVIDRQQFEIIIQAKINSKVLARERIPPYRKDVLSRSGKTVGGGDITRKKKLLEKQKEGKKRQKMFGKVEIKQEAFWAVLQR